MVTKPCLTCGTPADGPHCDEHAPRHHGRHVGNARQRGYDTAWTKLSKRARRMQPFCSACGSTEHLTVDHTPEAWRRHEQGLSIRLQDVVVLCSRCNTAAGSSRPGTDRARNTIDEIGRWGEAPRKPLPDRRSKPQTPSHTPPGEVDTTGGMP